MTPDRLATLARVRALLNEAVGLKLAGALDLPAFERLCAAMEAADPDNPDVLHPMIELSDPAWDTPTART